MLETIKLNEHNIEVILKNGNILPVKLLTINVGGYDRDLEAGTNINFNIIAEIVF